jgi:hypothetical protein
MEVPQCGRLKPWFSDKDELGRPRQRNGLLLRIAQPICLGIEQSVQCLRARATGLIASSPKPSEFEFM